MALCRVNSDGTLDAAFGNHGLITPISNAAGAPDARYIYFQSDGNIIVAGIDSNLYYLDLPGFIVAKFQPDGMPNPLFGNNGYNIQARSSIYVFIGSWAFCAAEGSVVPGKICPHS